MNSKVKSRSTTDADKLNKKAFIKQAAVDLFMKEGTIPSAANLAKESGIGKGTIYLYFSTKEEIYLDILQQEFTLWFEQILRRLNSSQDWTFETFAETTLEPLIDHPYFQDLARFAPGIIESNVSKERLIEYKRLLATGLENLGEVFSRSFSNENVADPTRTLVQSYGIISGVWTESQAIKHFKDMPEEKEFEELFINFRRDTGNMLVAFWKGMGWKEN